MKFSNCDDFTKLLAQLYREARKSKQVRPQAYYLQKLGISPKVAFDVLDLINNLSIWITRAYSLEIELVHRLLQDPNVEAFCKAIFVNTLPTQFWHSRIGKSSRQKIRNPIVGKQVIRSRPTALLNWSGTSSNRSTLTNDLKMKASETITLKAVDPRSLQKTVVFYNNSNDTDVFSKLRTVCADINQYVEEQDNSDNFFFMLESLLGTMKFFANERETFTLVKSARCAITRVGSKYAKQPVRTK